MLYVFPLRVPPCSTVIRLLLRSRWLNTLLVRIVPKYLYLEMLTTNGLYFLPLNVAPLLAFGLQIKDCCCRAAVLYLGVQLAFRKVQSNCLQFVNGLLEYLIRIVVLVERGATDAYLFAGRGYHTQRSLHCFNEGLFIVFNSVRHFQTI